MNITRGCLIAAAAIALALAQHTLYITSVLHAQFDHWPAVWLALDALTIVVMLIAVARFWATHRVIAAFIGAVGVAVLAVAVLENVVAKLPHSFWQPMSAAILLALFLIALLAHRE